MLMNARCGHSSSVWILADEPWLSVRTSPRIPAGYIIIKGKSTLGVVIGLILKNIYKCTLYGIINYYLFKKKKLNQYLNTIFKHLIF